MGNSRSIFDIIGPTMVGPSSSHTAGAVRLGALARAIFGELPAVAHIGLHGSFAATGEGHGTKVALIAGLLGMAPDDLRIPDAFALAGQAGLCFDFEEITLDEAHPNTVVFELISHPESENMSELHVEGSSIGGGNVVVTNVAGFAVEASGELPLLIVEHTDQPGVIHAVSGVLSDARINIAAMRVSREKRGARALMLIETDVQPDKTTITRLLKQAQVQSVKFVPAV